jgi:hypothetical protein
LPLLSPASLRAWRHRALHAVRRWTQRGGPPPAPLQVHRVSSLAAYREHIARHGTDAWDVENRLCEAHPDAPFTVPGWCWVDSVDVAFEVDYLYSGDAGGRRMPNWRERLLCPVCRMNNRQRACVHVASAYLGLQPDSRIYMTEQVTPTYALMRSRHPRLVGSEFLGPGIAGGSVNGAGIRHEDLTQLSFGNASLDAILTFDVLEHIPDFRKALAECRRVLADGGHMLFSIPFLEDSQATRTRARFGDDGALIHDHPQVYHGDPVNPEGGVLCFHEFGWDILDHARAAGFREASALLYRDARYGYLGGWQIAFLARK